VLFGISAYWPASCRVSSCLVVMCGAVLYGQTDTGSISGFVYDQTGAIIPGVTVSAVDTDRGIRRESATSTEAGAGRTTTP